MDNPKPRHGNIKGVFNQKLTPWVMRPVNVFALLCKMFTSALDHHRADYTIFLTVLTAAIVALVQGFLSPSLALLALLTMILQTALQDYRLFYYKQTPIVRASPNEQASSPHFRKLAPWLAVIPLLAGINMTLGWLVLVLIAAWAAPQFDRLAIRWRNRKKITRQELDRLRDYGPLVAVHVAGIDTSGYMINQWLPVLEKLDVPTVIIIREHNMLTHVNETSVPVLYVRGRTHVETILGMGIRCVLYPGNAMKNAEVMRTYQISHFFINHGESDKAVNQSKFLLAYDKILMGGPWAARRLKQAGLPLRENQIEYVGRPQTEMLLQRRPTPEPIQTVLYAPTWEGLQDSADYSSIGRFSSNLLDDLFNSREYKILFKPHPTTGYRERHRRKEVQRLQKLCKQNGHEFLDPESSIYDAMNRSNLLITDISSVLNDYLITGKPIVLCVTGNLTSHPLASEFPSSQAAYHLRQDEPENIFQLLQQIDEEDRLAKLREEVRSHSLGDFEQGSLARFKEVIHAGLEPTSRSA